MTLPPTESVAHFQRSQNIARIRLSLKANPLLSRNQTLIHSRISHHHPSSDSLSLSAHSLDNQEESLLQPTFEHAELFADKYELLQKLGEGSSGVVHRCVKRRSGGVFAVKTFMFDDQQLPQLKRNFLLVRGLDHTHVLRYEALYVDLKKHAGWLVMEYLPLASLARSGLRNEQDFRRVVHQLLETLQYLHKRAITHRDVKMENVLYDAHQRKVKLIDFGICRKHRRRAANFDMLTITGTLYYRAPEMFEGGGYGDPVDVWAVGILLFKLVTGHTPFESEYHSQTIKNIMAGEIVFPAVFEEYSPAIKTLISRMLRKDPSQRLSASDCLRDIWFYPMPKYLPIHRGSYNQPQQEQQKKSSPLIKAGKLLNFHSYIRNINGDEFHCIDSDQEQRISTKKKRSHRSFAEGMGFAF